MTRPEYRSEVRWNEAEGLFEATSPDFPTASGHGKSKEEALQQLGNSVDGVLSGMEKIGLSRADSKG